MGCNCGGGGTALANYTIKRPDGTTETKTAVTEAEARLVAARVKGSTYSRTS